ncbi:uncharacterized protein N7446_013591 [Penicillium canescens]|uniref:uncharacterized protein n=1 Tax=Penicillium canescens TaxID=5083 RepID=UPI0026DF00EC|nr:uncharacterized protein N7446_013591 [Penicillium canescens]KAJ6042525.1 hypothetical protein N7446_013591 [Penicillium canescens]
MALLQTSLIWIVYAVVVVILLAVASVFIYVYQTPRDRSPSVTLTCIISITSLLATVLLLPVDVALVSSTTSSKLGQRKDWATQDVVDRITYSLTIIYYLLYSLDALLCLLVIPFTYFWYEEYDEVATETGEQTVGQRIWGALKYTLSFVAIVVILFLVGFFVPVSQGKSDMDLDYFRRLLTENHGERALTFALGLLMTIGLCLYVLYTSAGLALLPISLIKTAPSISSATLRASTRQQLETNRERQRQLEGRCAGNPELLSSKDRRELDTLTREERTLSRRQRLAEESQGEGRSWLMKAKNSICKHRCGYILARVNIFNPVNWALVQSAKVFPIDYAIFTVLVLLFFCSSVVGIAVVGIRFLWIRIFQIRNGHTSPQALLLATAMLMLIILALNYSISMVVAPQYATFGPQTFCDRAPGLFLGKPDCSDSKELIKPCSELAKNPDAQQVCTPSVVSTFLNRVTLNYPFFGVVFFWAQFLFLGLYLIVFVTSLLRSPKLDERQLDEDAEEAEEEGLLANTGRRFNASWQDITGRAARSELSHS